MDKNKFVVFDNTPHKQYMGLKEKVRDVQITFFREEIEEQGYKLSEPVSLIQFPFDNRLNPIYNMFFWNVIPDLKENVDIYFPPIQFIRHNFWTTNVVNGISFTFDEHGFLDNTSWFYDNQLISFVNIKYKQNNLVSKITKKQTLVNGLYTPGDSPKGDPYDGAFSLTQEYEYDYKNLDSLFKVTIHGYLPEKKDPFWFESIHEYRFNDDHLEMNVKDNKNILYCIYLNSNNRASKIDVYNNGVKDKSVLLKDNFVYSSMPVGESELINIEYDDLFRVIKCKRSLPEEWRFEYDNKLGLMTRMVYSGFSEKIVYYITYNYDEYGNWIQMNITADRSIYDELEANLYDIEKKMDSIRRKMSYKEYYEGWPINAYELNDEYRELESERNRKQASRNFIKVQTSRYIIKRNIITIQDPMYGNQ